MLSSQSHKIVVFCCNWVIMVKQLSNSLKVAQPSNHVSCPVPSHSCSSNVGVCVNFLMPYGRRHLRVNGFKMAPCAILDFWNSNFLTVWTVKRPILHHCAKFREDRSNIAEISQFLWFLRRRPKPSWISKMVCPLQGADSRQHVKFHQNRSSTVGDMAI